jgi:flagellar biogenesis protein FliO
MVALMTQLALVTAMVVGFLLLVYYLLKQNPRLLQGFSLSALLPTPSSSDMGLVIESRLPLDAKKSLMIIRAGTERYLIGATIDRIDAITRMGDSQQALSAMTANPLTADMATLAPTAYPPDTVGERPVGLSRLNTPFATTPTAAKALTAIPTARGSFQQQLHQVAQQQANKPPAEVNNPPALNPTFTIPQPRRQSRGLNKIT